MIQVHHLSKSFRTYKKEPGLKGAVKGLFRRKYETVQAVQDISFAIEEGELVGFVGPNGAGKTTTLKMLAGLLYPTSGTAQVLGYVPWERPDGYRRQFALLLGQKNQLWWDLPARDSFELNRHIYGIERAHFERTVQELSALLGVEDKLSVMVRELSLGERMKMELIAALLHHPRVLLLDEPTLGLDVVSQKTVRDFLRHHNQTTRTTILLTSHYMADIEALCERVLIIDHGRLFFDGRLAEVLERYADDKLITIELGPGGPPPPSQLARHGEVLELTDARVRLRVRREQVIPVCKALLDELPVKDIDIEETPIEEIVRRLFARNHSPGRPASTN
ncbi:ATP-binding cassette domain-containing protein [Fontisphaera persica]|uniref:ABC transporter ATP-binding protein n=1 Tax=Fontisphaera persica TaxID=2974023 RepID=UPI0024C0A883|nr:ATP-binding cassette domain-containing protein [Fontisphaera persica]WCJ61249.1 ATP-binding cassette domain-containing protein [Fontisphaera persica]